jgi:hypothetical protein
MREYRTIRASVFIYDCSRLLFLLSLLVNFLSFDPAGPSGLFQGPQVNFMAGFPFLLYAAPNALFPLMSFFLLIRLKPSKAYIPLYIAGKAIVLSAAAAWFFFAFSRGLPRVVLPVFVLGAADLGSILGMAVLNDGLRETAAPELPGETPEEEIQPEQAGGE